MPIWMINYIGRAMGISQVLDSANYKQKLDNNMLSYSDPLLEPPRQSQMDLTAPGQVSSWTSPPWRDRGTGWLAQRQTMLSHSWGELLIMWRVISVSSQISGIVLCNYLTSLLFLIISLVLRRFSVHLICFQGPLWCNIQSQLYY